MWRNGGFEMVWEGMDGFGIVFQNGHNVEVKRPQKKIAPALTKHIL
jgi:hypothetical protein